MPSHHTYPFKTVYYSKMKVAKFYTAPINPLVPYSPCISISVLHPYKKDPPLISKITNPVTLREFDSATVFTWATITELPNG
jgi:hypothetical protein